MSVGVNPPKTPVTKGSNGIAAATLPNICKMPGPPAPFVPVPLPNIGKSGEKPDGYTKSVKVEGNPVAIKGASFGSMGDMASKGTGGGIVSANTHGPCKFIGPGSMDVKFEGKNVHLLGDPVTNNGAGGGMPANAATMMGVIQMTGLVTAVEEGKCPICEKTHEELKETEETKADAGALATNFKAEVAAATRPVQTMLGVVHCKCGKKYADQSAMTTVELCKAAKAAGMKHPAGVTVSYSHSKKELDKAYLETLDKVKAAIQAHLGNSQVFQDTLAEAEIRARDSNEKRSGPAAYPPGTCAAQKALVLVMDDGALPAAMTEEWFSSVGRETQAPVEYIDNRTGTREVKVETFKPGKTVPPCKACELIVPLLLCNGDKEKCDHKS